MSRFSRKTQAIIKASLRPSTVRAYGNYNLRFLRWAVQHCPNNQAIYTEATVRGFLENFVCNRFSFGTIRSMYCAIRFFFTRSFPDIKFDPVTWDDFLKGARNLCKKSIRREFTWDPQDYVNWVAMQPLPATLAASAQELAAILALSASLRSADLLNLDGDYEIVGDELRLKFIDRGKTVEEDGRIKEGISLSRYHGNARLCAHALVKRYITSSRLHYASKKWERPRQLFASTTAARPLKVATIQKYLVKELAAAGIKDPNGLGYTAHSFRRSAASSAYFRGFSFDQITALAGWKRKSTFQRHYNLKMIRQAQNLLPDEQSPMEIAQEYIDQICPLEDQNDAAFDEAEVLHYRAFCYSCMSVRCQTSKLCASMLPSPESDLQMAMKI